MVCSLFFTGFDENSFLYCCIVIIANTIVFFIEYKNQKFSKIILLGFIFRCLLLIWDCNFSHIYRFPNSGVDSSAFNKQAIRCIETGNFSNTLFYVKIVAFAYSLFGPQQPIAQYINILLSISTIITAIDIMDFLNIDYNIKKAGVAILCFLPNFAIMNCLLLRESFFILFTTLSLKFALIWFNNNDGRLFCLSMVFSIVGSFFHSGSLSIAAGTIILYVLFDRKKNLFNLAISRLLLSVIIVVFIFIINKIFNGVILKQFSRANSIDGILVTAKLYNEGGSAYTAGFNISNKYLDLIINTPIRMIYFLSSPMPWDWRGVNDMIAFAFDASIYAYIFLKATIILFRKNNSYNKKILLALTIYCVVAAGMFSWGVSNSGTALRHRDKFLTLFVILYCIEKQEDNHSFKKYITK